MFGGWVSIEEVRVDDMDVASSTILERFEFVEEILFHDVVIELLGSSYIEGEASDFATDFILMGFVPVILGSSGGESGNEVVVVEFVGHLTQVIT